MLNKFLKFTKAIAAPSFARLLDNLLRYHIVPFLRKLTVLSGTAMARKSSYCRTGRRKKANTTQPIPGLKIFSPYFLT